MVLSPSRECHVGESGCLVAHFRSRCGPVAHRRRLIRAGKRRARSSQGDLSNARRPVRVEGEKERGKRKEAERERERGERERGKCARGKISRWKGIAGVYRGSFGGL